MPFAVVIQAAVGILVVKPVGGKGLFGGHLLGSRMLCTYRLMVLVDRFVLLMGRLLGNYL